MMAYCADVGILVLIYQDVLEAVLILRQHFREARQQLVHLEEQVIKIHCAVAEAAIRVALVNLADHRAAAAGIFRLDCRMSCL